MKKLISLILVLATALTLFACGGKETPEHADTPNPGVTAEKPDETPKSESEDPVTDTPGTVGESYTFTYGSTTIAMNADASVIVAALGEPKKYTEEESCAFEGLSKTYFFGSFYLETYPDHGTDRVYCVWFADDSVTTEEGIYIGANQQQVEDTYGAQWYNGKNAYVVQSGDCVLTIILENGVVCSIQYTAVTQ